MSFHVPEGFRRKEGPLASTRKAGNNGAFCVPLAGGAANIIASDGMGWEHVSISYPDHTPSWADCCRVKDLFWDEEDVVIQFHPPKSEYVNLHKHCLHLWRPVGLVLPRPPKILVGF